MKHFTDLEAWKVGMDILKEVYRLTKRLPKEELFGMTSQIRKASASILANTAEGFGRFTYQDKANKFTIARGECTETEAFVHMMVALMYISAQEAASVFALIDREQKLLSGLISSCKRRA